MKIIYQSNLQKLIYHMVNNYLVPRGIVLRNLLWKEEVSNGMCTLKSVIKLWDPYVLSSLWYMLTKFSKPTFDVTGTTSEKRPYNELNKVFTWTSVLIILDHGMTVWKHILSCSNHFWTEGIWALWTKYKNENIKRNHPHAPFELLKHD